METAAAAGLEKDGAMSWKHTSQTGQRWKMLVFVAFVQLVYVSASVSQMSLVREWESMDLLVPGEGGQGTSRRPLDLHFDKFSVFWKYLHLDVYNDRLFVAFDLHRAPFSLAYHNLSDTSKSLLLQPYPSWDAHSDEHGDRQIHDVVALRADRCGRIWVIDKVDDANEHRIIVFDLNTDRILRKYTFRYSINLHIGFSMVVDDDDCENPYLYISDSRQGGIWTYCWADETAWHHPGDFVSAMVLAPNKSESYSIVYYNMFGVGVWYISTRYLRDKTSYLMEFGHKGEHYVYLESTVLDAKNNVLFVRTFYNSTTIMAYPCWNRYASCDPSGWHDIAVNTTHEVTQIILDKNGNLWAFTETSTLDNKTNLSIFSLDITSANVELNKNDTTNTTKLNEAATAATVSATNTTEQASGVDYDGSSNSTVTTEDITGGTPNSNITATDPASSTTEQASGIGDRISNTTVTIEETIASTPNSDVKTQRTSLTRCSAKADPTTP
ncbi:protein yellow-like [Aricia agestis]|uniref:protein yellow-like n=1 Tax=Aricia agestis TaxID=91739 RepID=UPI001C2043DA|nr:protein yellow-like [Aricia agestis]